MQSENGGIGMSRKYIVGGFLIVLAAAAIALLAPDIKRYVKISTM